MAKPYEPYTGSVVTREQAKSLGLTRFFTGKPCKHGHLSQRTTCNGACIQCNQTTTLALYHSESEEKRAKRRERAVAFAAAHREERRAYISEYIKTPTGRSKRREWQIANRERINELALEANKRNKEAVNARWSRYNASPKGRLNGVIGEMRRRMRTLSAEGTHNADDIRRIGDRQKWGCHWCGKPTKQSFHVDHIQPLAKGGSNWPSNLCISCPECNRQKNALDPLVFARRLGKLL